MYRPRHERSSPAADEPTSSTGVRVIDRGSIPRARLVLAALILATAALWLFRHMDRPLTGDSVRYAAIARRMVESGDWVQPRVMELLDWWKPPLSYWLVATSMELFGSTPFAAMVPSTLAGALLVLCVFLVMERLAGRLAGVVSALLLLFTPDFVRHTVTCRLESLLQLFGLLALVSIEKAHVRPGWFLAFWAFLGASVLTKGATGLVPLVVLALTALVTWRAYPFNRRRFWTAVPLGLLVAGPWYGLMSWRHGGEFWATHFGREIAGRVGSRSAAHIGKMLIASVDFVGVSAFFAPLGAALTVRDAKRDQRIARFAVFGGIWIVFVLVTQVLNNNAFARYMYNAFVPIAGFAGYGIAALLDRRLPRAAPIGIALVALGVAIGVHLIESSPAERHVAHQLVLDGIVKDATPGPLLAVVYEPEEVETFVWFHLHRSTTWILPEVYLRERASHPESFAGRLAIVDDRGWDVLDFATVDVLQHANVFSLVRFR